MSFPVFFVFGSARGNSRFAPLFHSANFFFPNNTGPRRLNEEELTELMRLAEPDPEGNVAVPSKGAFGGIWFLWLTGVTRKTLHENGRKLGEADLFFLGGEGLCKFEMTWEVLYRWFWYVLIQSFLKCGTAMVIWKRMGSGMPFEDVTRADP